MRSIRNLSFGFLFVTLVLASTRSARAFDWVELWAESVPCEEMDCNENQELCDQWCYNFWQGTINLTHCFEDSGYCYYACYCNIPS